MIKKAKINDKIVDIITFDDLYSHSTEYQNNLTAIEHDGTIYPLRGKNDVRPGFYYDENSPIAKFVKPSKEEEQEYSSENIIDFSDVESIKDVINKQSKLRNMERSILTTVDNIFKPATHPNDAPEMVALKEAVREKNIDLDKYSQRFGNNYNNERRLFNNNSITLIKLKSMCNALDIKATLTLEDASPDVPNPINKTITIELTSGGDDGAES